MKKFAYFLLSCAALATASSCSKDNDATPTGPNVSSGNSYTGEGDNPACALQAEMVIRIELYR
ncbi:hypothetical protein [Hymenobacter lapidarius]|uniref:hypothetical protein n=1 Tax=Hymenobacter lapidarius TaxID=1908237 RepID=UPI000F780D10|nr:hypothetical protein [Hymenobacter lapidarius]